MWRWRDLRSLIEEPVEWNSLEEIVSLCLKAAVDREISKPKLRNPTLLYN